MCHAFCGVLHVWGNGASVSAMSGCYGLPRAVVTLLRHLEPHKDCMKWSISEASHKVTLTLTWNFRRHKESLWDRLQRTLKFSKSEDAGGPCTVPSEVTKFLDQSPRQVNNRQHSPLKRQMSFGRFTPTNTPAPPVSCTTSRRPLQRQASLHAFSPPPPRGYRSMSNRYSWPGASSPMSIRAPLRTSTPVTRANTLPHHIHGICSPVRPPLLRSHSDTTPHITPRIKLTYRSVDEIERSLEDLTEQTMEENRAELMHIRSEWDRTIHEWPQRAQSENGTLCSSMDWSDSESEANLLMTIGNDTILRCLTSCDKILYRNSTPITWHQLSI